MKALDVVASCQDGIYRNNVPINNEGPLISITARFQLEVLDFSDALFVEGFDDAVVAVSNQVINILANYFFNLVCISQQIVPCFPASDLKKNFIIHLAGVGLVCPHFCDCGFACFGPFQLALEHLSV